MPNMELLVRAVELRDLRAVAASHAATLKVKADAFQAENATEIAEANAARKAVEAAEIALKAVTLAAYLADVKLNGDDASKTPVPGASVKLFDVIEYDAQKALEWAKKTGMAVKPESLDVAAFTKIAAATKLDFVTYKQEPRVQVATDLDKALSSVEAAAEINTGVSV